MTAKLNAEKQRSRGRRRGKKKLILSILLPPLPLCFSASSLRIESKDVPTRRQELPDLQRRARDLHRGSPWRSLHPAEEERRDGRWRELSGAQDRPYHPQRRHGQREGAAA